MNINRFGAKQRQIGEQLASQLGANKTLSQIKNQNSGYKEIFNTAVAEVGMDKFVHYVLQNNPIWAHNVLRYVPNLGQYREAIIICI